MNMGIGLQQLLRRKEAVEAAQVVDVPTISEEHRSALVDALSLVNDGCELVAITESEARYEEPIRGKRRRKTTYSVIHIPTQQVREQVILCSYLSERVRGITWAIIGMDIYCIENAQPIAKWDLIKDQLFPLTEECRRVFGIAVASDRYERYLVAIGVKERNE